MRLEEERENKEIRGEMMRKGEETKAALPAWDATRCWLSKHSVVKVCALCTWMRRALRLGGARMAAVSDLLGEGLQSEKKKESKLLLTCMSQVLLLLYFRIYVIRFMYRLLFKQSIKTTI